MRIELDSYINTAANIKSQITFDVFCRSCINTDTELASIIAKRVTLISSIDLE